MQRADYGTFIAILSAILKFALSPHFFFQVDLGFLRNITAIGTQGAISKETKKHYFVRSYKVDVSSTEEDWITIKEGSKHKVRELRSAAPSAD